MHIGILQTGHAPDAIRAQRGDYVDIFPAMLAGRGLTFTGYSVVDGTFPPGIDACDGWLITGSKHGAYEDHDWIPPLEEFIRDAHAAKKPMVGICFGHQIIAQALGGRVEKYKGGWVVGRQEYDFGDRVLAMNAWHQDQVVEAPAGARTIAHRDRCDHAALVYGDHILTLQPHPEYDAELLETLARTRGPGVVPDVLLQQVHAELDKPTDNPRVADWIATFLKEAAHG